MKKILTTVSALALLVSAATAGTIALWNFNDNNLIVDQGSGTLSLVNTSSNFETDPTKVSPNDPGGASLEVYGWPSQNAADKTHGIRFNVSTAGKSNIKIKWDIRHNIKNGESGPNTSLFQYSTDGGTTWIDGPKWTSSGDQWYLNREVDLSSVPNVNNNPNFAFRIMGAWQPGQGKYMPCAGSAYAATRKWRLDLIRVHDDPAPTLPNTIALWDFNDVRDLVADYGDGSSFAQLVGGIALDGDGYSDDFAHSEEPYDSSSSSDPALKGKCLDTVGYPAQSSGNRTAGVQFNVSTAGYTGIKLFFDVKHKLSSSRFIRVQYTANRNANPVTWVNASPLFDHEITDLTQDAWWFNGNMVDLTGVSAVNNNPNFAFRIVTEFNPENNSSYAPSRSDSTYGGAANKHRFDMVRVTAESAAPTFPNKNIVEAKQLGQWSKVSLQNAAVTAMHPDYFWVQTDDRSCGIKVYAPQHNLNPGWRVNISGITRKGRDTEKYIYANYAGRNGSAVEDIVPMFLTTKNLGGGDWFYNPQNGAGQIGVPGGVGLNNVGLYVKVCGWVTAYVEEDDDPGYYQFMYVDDGCGLYDGNLFGPNNTPALGIRVALPKNFSGNYLGKYVEVLGVSSIDRVGGITDDVVRCIRRPVINIIEQVPEN